MALPGICTLQSWLLMAILAATMITDVLSENQREKERGSHRDAVTMIPDFSSFALTREPLLLPETSHKMEEKVTNHDKNLLRSRFQQDREVDDTVFPVSERQGHDSEKIGMDWTEDHRVNGILQEEAAPKAISNRNPRQRMQTRLLPKEGTERKHEQGEEKIGRKTSAAFPAALGGFERSVNSSIAQNATKGFHASRLHRSIRSQPGHHRRRRVRSVEQLLHPSTTDAGWAVTGHAAAVAGVTDSTNRFVNESECSPSLTEARSNRSALLELYRGICSLSCAQKISFPDFQEMPWICPVCFCDPLCMTFGDCCPDFDLTETSHSSQNGSREHEPCLDIGAVATNDHVTSSCPAGHPLQDTCSPPLPPRLDPRDVDIFKNVLPVSDAGSGRHYRNRACAHCNGVGETVLWLTVLRCADELLALTSSDPFAVTIPRSVLREALSRRDCSVTFIPNVERSASLISDSPSLCLRIGPKRECKFSGAAAVQAEFSSTAQPTSTEATERDEDETVLDSHAPFDLLRELCLTSSILPMTDPEGNILYANMFCYICAYACQAVLVPSKPVNVKLRSWTSLAVIHTYTMTTSLDVTFLRGPFRSSSNLPLTCPDMEQPDPYKGGCRPTQPPDNFLADDNNGRDGRGGGQEGGNASIVLCFSAFFSVQPGLNSTREGMLGEVWSDALRAHFSILSSTASFRLCSPTRTAGAAEEVEDQELSVLVEPPPGKTIEVLGALLQRYRGTHRDPWVLKLPAGPQFQLWRLPCRTTASLVANATVVCIGDMPALTLDPDLPTRYTLQRSSGRRDVVWVLSPLLTCRQTTLTSADEFRIVSDWQDYIQLTGSKTHLLYEDYLLSQNLDIALVCYDDFLGFQDINSVLVTRPGTGEVQENHVHSADAECCKCCDQWEQGDDDDADDDNNDGRRREKGSNESADEEIGGRAEEAVNGDEDAVYEGTEEQCLLCCGSTMQVVDYVDDDTSNDSLHEQLSHLRHKRHAYYDSTFEMCGKAARSMRTGVSWLETVLLHLSLKCLLLG